MERGWEYVPRVTIEEESAQLGSKSKMGLLPNNQSDGSSLNSETPYDLELSL